jgi:hypothetical protein
VNPKKINMTTLTLGRLLSDVLKTSKLLPPETQILIDTGIEEDGVKVYTNVEDMFIQKLCANPEDETRMVFIIKAGEYQLEIGDADRAPVG